MKILLKVLLSSVILFSLAGCGKDSTLEKINVKGTSYGELLDIMNKYSDDIDFDTITAGANCFTGMTTKQIKTEKYGEVTVEFSYCKSSESYYIHIFN